MNKFKWKFVIEKKCTFESGVKILKLSFLFYETGDNDSNIYGTQSNTYDAAFTKTVNDIKPLTISPKVPS